MIIFLAIIGLIFLIITATVLVEVERFGWATIVLLGSVIAAQVLHVLPVWAFVSTHVIETALYALAYVGIGIIWSFVKWFSFLMGARDKYRDLKRQWVAFRPADQLPVDFANLSRDHTELFQRFLYNQYERSSYRKHQNPLAELANGKRPRAADNKSRIVSWMSFWPCSMIGTLLNDPVRRLCNFLFTSFKALYQQMSDAVFAKDSELK